LKALKQMSLMVRGQPTVMSFADVFLMLTALFAGLARLGVIMKKLQPAGAAAGAGH
jgi:DHA2 family multidrug resistance protein